MSLATQLLWALDHVFPINPAARMTSTEQTAHEVTKAPGTMGRYLDALGETTLDVLDFGCGWGGETLWLASRGRSCGGADVADEVIATARRALAASGDANCTFVHMPDGRLAFEEERFDAVLSTNTFEHVMDLDLAFSEIFRVLRPGGSLLTRFGPLFYSPFGYHLYWACAVPYAHLLFGLPPILELRNVRAPSPMRATTWQEMGLNGRRFADYKGAAERAGFELTRFEPLAVKNLRAMTAIPLVRDLFIFGVDAHLRKPLA